MKILIKIEANNIIGSTGDKMMEPMNTNKKGGTAMSLALANMTDNLVPVSDFSQGKAGKIFNDVFQNNKEYIVLRNNQPTAVVLSVHEYKETQEKIDRLEKLLEFAENTYLLDIASNRDTSTATDFESFIKEQGFSMQEIDKLAESVDIE